MQTLDLVSDDLSVQFGLDVALDATVLGNGDPLVLVLPGVERADEDEAFLQELAAEATVVAPRHPGFGRSAQPDWCRTVSDIADIYLDWIEKSQSSDVTVVGLQFGGWVALDMAVRRSPRISRLVLVDSFGVKLGGITERDFVDVFATPRAELEKLTYADSSHALGDLSVADEYAVLESLRNEEALAAYGWQPYLHDPRLAPALGRIDVPTLVVWGSQDGVARPDYGRRLAEAIPDARFVQIDDAGHRPQVEVPRELCDLIRKARTSPDQLREEA